MITVDNFGNLITNIDAEVVLATGRRSIVHVGGRDVFRSSERTATSSPESMLALINSYDVLEGRPSRGERVRRAVGRARRPRRP